MTVQTQVNKTDPLPGNGSTTVFSFAPMVIFESGNLVVTHTVTATGVETVLSEGASDTTYSVGLTSYPATGSITYPAVGGTPIPSTETITIKRVLTLEQQTDLENQGGYFPDTMEEALDKLLMIDLQQQELIGRSVLFPISYTSLSTNEAASPGASRYLRINSSGDGLEWVALATTTADASTSTPSTSSRSAASAGSGTDFSRDDHVHLLPAIVDADLPVVSVSKGGTGSSTASAARTALGLVIGTDVLAVNGTPTGDGSSLTGIRIQGVETVYIPAGAMTPRTTNGPSSATVEYATNDVMVKHLDFSGSTNEAAQWTIAMPKSSDETGDLLFTPIWTGAAGAGTVEFEFSALALSNDDAIDAAFGTAVATTDTFITAGDVHISPTTTTVTPAGTWAENDLVVFQIERDPATDTKAEDARLIGVKMTFVTNAGDDS